MKYLSTLPFLLILPILSVSAEEKPDKPMENILFIGSPPRVGTLDGVKFQYRNVAYINDAYAVYMCYRERQENDFKIGERVFGSDMPATATQPQGVIHRIVLEWPAYGPQRSYYEIPQELYRDMSEHHLEHQSKAQTLFSLARKGSMVTLFLSGGDAAGSYAVNWIIDLETKRVRRIVAAGEWDEVRPSPWIDLKKVEKPAIVMAPDQDGKPAPRE